MNALDLWARRPFFIRIRRIRQWLEALKAESRVVSLRFLALDLWRGALGVGGVDKTAWRQRIRACRRCPVYDRNRKTCRPYPGARIGCGCFMPLKALVRQNACWIRQIRPDGQHGFD